MSENKGSGKSESSKAERRFIAPDDVETREDELTYLIGEAEPFTGAVVLRDKHWQPRYFGYYLKGHLHGAEMRWYPSGILKRSYDYERGEKIRHREWFENGNPKIDAMMKEGVAYGRHVTWFEDGRERFVGSFLENLQWHGHIKDFAEDGTVMWDAEFDHGRYVSGVYPESEKQNLIDAGMLKPE